MIELGDLVRIAYSFPFKDGQGGFLGGHIGKVTEIPLWEARRKGRGDNYDVRLAMTIRGEECDFLMNTSVLRKVSPLELLAMEASDVV